MGETTEEALRPAVANERKQRQDLKERWDTWFRLRKMEGEGTVTNPLRFWLQEMIDRPITWITENIIFPLHDKYKPAFYHRKFSRVPEIDQCTVTDTKCAFEASVQYKFDRQVDGNILHILMERMEDCMNHHEFDKGESIAPCIPLMEEFEEAELNFFIKYGELGDYATPLDIYMKQKHRMIWERRHPEVMAERERVFREHKRNLTMGRYNPSFWKQGLPLFQNKEEQPQHPYHMGHEDNLFEDNPISKDWQFYRDVHTPGTEANEWEKFREKTTYDPNETF